MEKIEKKKIQQIFNRFKKLKVFVIGDAMLDCYWKGSIDRISPEAPVPVFSVSSKTEKLGGAANVALNCVALGAQVSLFTVLGHDKDGKTLLQLLQNQAIDTDGCLLSKSRVTTSKSRLMSKNQQVIRIDESIRIDDSIRIEDFIDIDDFINIEPVINIEYAINDEQDVGFEYFVNDE